MLTVLVHFSEFHWCRRPDSTRAIEIYPTRESLQVGVKLKPSTYARLIDLSRILGSSKYLEQYFENAAGRVYRYYPGPGRHWGGVVGTWRRGAQRAGTAWGIVHLVKRLPGPVFPAGWHGKGQISAPGTPAQGTKPSCRVGFYRVTGFCRGWVHSLWALNLCRLNNLSPMDRL